MCLQYNKIVVRSTSHRIEVISERCCDGNTSVPIVVFLSLHWYYPHATLVTSDMQLFTVTDSGNETVTCCYHFHNVTLLLAETVNHLLPLIKYQYSA